MASANIAELKQGNTAQKTASVSSFNPDAWHAMQERDDQLIRDSVLHGYAGKEYVYQFSINGSNVTGVSVVGARELASHYGGIKHRIVASVDKTGSLFVFKSFEPLAVQANIIPQLADEEDFYEVVIEITDIKTGNSIQVRKKESKIEKRSAKKGGGSYERPHYDVIAESKAYRNGVLSIIPQNVIKEFEARALRAGNSGNEKTITQLREGAVAFCAKHGIAVNRQAVSNLTYAEMQGLGAAAAGGADSFKEAAEALGILQTKPDPQDGGHRQVEQKQSTTIPQQTRAPATVPHDAETGEIRDPAGTQQQSNGGAPGFADAHAAVRAGDLDLARDIARHLPEAQQQQIEAAIANLSGDQQQDAPTRGRGRQRGQGGLGLD